MTDDPRKSLTTTEPLHRGLRLLAFQRDHLLSLETDLAIEAHLAWHRSKMKAGARIPKGKAK